MSCLRLISPVDGSLYAERSCTTSLALDHALAQAREAQRSWRLLPIETRATYCLKAVEAMLAMSDEIVPELAWQMGRPVRYGAGELRGFAERARYMIGIAGEALADVVPAPIDGFRRYIRREPLGTVLVIAPWNYPYLTAVNSVIPALMAGNAVLLKHASQTLLVGERFAEAFRRAGLPDGLFHHPVLDHGQTGALIASGHVQQVNFTGSVAGGRLMESAAAGHFIGVGLELGGKAPAYVRADANLAHAVEKALYPAFVEGFIELTRQYVLGNPLEQSTTLGPLVNDHAASFVRAQIAEARAKGARPLIDSKQFAADALGSPYMAPQVLVDVDHSMAVMREESFGPVVGIMAVDNDAQAVELMNDSPFGLSASIWSADLAAAEQLGQQIDTGTLFMNRCDALDPALAWTGVKNTGRGASLSRIGYEHLTRPKSFHLRHAL